MKRLICVFIALALCTSMFSVTAFATDMDHQDDILYLSNKPVGSIADEIKDSKNVLVKKYSNAVAADIIDAQYVVVEFDSLQYDSDFLEYVRLLLDVGKVLFIRASGYTANETLIKYLFSYGTENEPLLVETAEDALISRIYTIGFVVYWDSAKHLQVIRQTAYTLPDAAIEESTPAYSDAQDSNMLCTDTIDLNVEMPCVNLTFDQELIAISDLLTYVAPTQVEFSVDQDINLSAQTFETGANYEKLYSSLLIYNTEGRYLGSLTRKIYASRLYPTPEVTDGPLTQANTTYTKWAFQSVVTMSPNFASRVVSLDLYCSFTTYPVASGNLTYKNVIWDYLPKTDTDGTTEVTYSIGANASKEGAKVEGGVSWTATYKDINFTVSYQAGSDITTNCAAWNYKIGRNAILWADEVIFAKDVQKSAVDIISAVLIKNEGHSTVGVQLNTKPTFGWTDNYLIAYKASLSSSVVFILPVN